jgi:hypothetical protein
MPHLSSGWIIWLTVLFFTKYEFCCAYGTFLVSFTSARETWDQHCRCCVDVIVQCTFCSASFSPYAAYHPVVDDTVLSLYVFLGLSCKQPLIYSLCLCKYKTCQSFMCDIYNFHFDVTCIPPQCCSIPSKYNSRSLYVSFFSVVWTFSGRMDFIHFF